MSEIITIGLIREGKNPPDMRVPLSPNQCADIMQKYPNVKVCVQSSSVRKYSDSDYRSAGVEVRDDISDCQILMGVKEVPIEMLVPNKTYFFFSHTIKMQPYNSKLLKAILEKKITLIDYEVLTDHRGTRVIGFGRYAGIVGAYNAFRALGMRTGAFDLKPAHLCEDRREMETELSMVKLAPDYKIVLTGLGRVGNGALEIIRKLNIREVKPAEFLEQTFNEPVFTVLGVEHYFALENGFADKMDIYQNPAPYRSVFYRYAAAADMYIACHYWDSRGPYIFTREDAKRQDWKVSVVADISCDIDGPVASTIRPSAIQDPVYGYHRYLEKETASNDPDAITVMAVDNLPCELPKDSSADFGNEFMQFVLPQIVEGDPQKMLERATIARDGELTPRYGYLKDYAEGKIQEEA